MAIPRIYCRMLRKGCPLLPTKKCFWNVCENKERIPLVLTYHLFSSFIKQSLLYNFIILTRDPGTGAIFPAPPVVAPQRICSLRDILVQTSCRSQTEVPRNFRMSTSPLPHLPVHNIQRPCMWTQEFNHHPWTVYLQIRERCVLHLVSSMPPPIHQKTSHTLCEWFSEHLQSVQKNTGGFPDTERLTLLGTVYQTTVKGLRKCSVAVFRQKQLLQMEIIFGLSTMQLEGLNAFHFM